MSGCWTEHTYINTDVCAAPPGAGPHNRCSGEWKEINKAEPCTHCLCRVQGTADRLDQILWAQARDVVSVQLAHWSAAAPGAGALPAAEKAGPSTEQTARCRGGGLAVLAAEKGASKAPKFHTVGLGAGPWDQGLTSLQCPRSYAEHFLSQGPLTAPPTPARECSG